MEVIKLYIGKLIWVFGFLILKCCWEICCGTRLRKRNGPKPLFAKELKSISNETLFPNFSRFSSTFIWVFIRRFIVNRRSFSERHLFAFLTRNEFIAQYLFKLVWFIFCQIFFLLLRKWIPLWFFQQRHVELAPACSWWMRWSPPSVNSERLRPRSTATACPSPSTTAPSVAPGKWTGCPGVCRPPFAEVHPEIKIDQWIWKFGQYFWRIWFEKTKSKNKEYVLKRIFFKSRWPSFYVAFLQFCIYMIKTCLFVWDAASTFSIILIFLYANFFIYEILYFGFVSFAYH